MNQFTVGGIRLTPGFCNKISTHPVSSGTTEPLVSITETDRNKLIESSIQSYTVNIVMSLPNTLLDISNAPLTSGFFLDQEKKTIFLSYVGVNNIVTDMASFGTSTILCRGFNITYDGGDADCLYNMYHIQFEYKLLGENFQSVDAIIVHDFNLDPVLSRGTVTTVRTSRQ